MYVLSHSVISDSVAACTVAGQGPLSMGFSRQEYWRGLPFSTPGDLSHPGIKPTSLASPALAGRYFTTQFSSVQFSQFRRSVMSNSLQSHEPKHTRPPCPSPTPRVHPDSCASSWWCHPAISSSVVPFSSCPQSLPASRSFPVSQLVTWGGQSIGVSASASILPMNTQDWSPLGWTGWISLQSKGLSRVFSNTTVQKHQFFSTPLSSQFNSHPYMTTGKTIALTRRSFVGKVMSLLLNTLFRLVITFLPRSERLLISWLQSPSAVFWSPPK